mmetsp:Transcript_19955/g.42821  ORF Transcript_19955/g.42821 Transcript_19955/m.42821 type:complete len:83 (+) Transcript_19955:1484-1732(+)
MSFAYSWDKTMITRRRMEKTTEREWECIGVELNEKGEMLWWQAMERRRMGLLSLQTADIRIFVIFLEAGGRIGTGSQVKRCA